MPQAWSVKILPGEGFVPDVYSPDGVPPKELLAEKGDLVSWNNQTDQEHQLVETAPDGEPLGTDPMTDVISPWQSSYPGYVVQVPGGSTIYYCCTFHEDERGTIEVTA